MLAKVTAIESGSQFLDGRRRITLKLKSADSMYDRVRLSERDIAIVGLRLDDEIELTFGCDGAKIREERKLRQQQAG